MKLLLVAVLSLKAQSFQVPHSLRSPLSSSGTFRQSITMPVSSLSATEGDDGAAFESKAEVPKPKAVSDTGTADETKVDITDGSVEAEIPKPKAVSDDDDDDDSEGGADADVSEVEVPSPEEISDAGTVEDVEPEPPMTKEVPDVVEDSSEQPEEVPKKSKEGSPPSKTEGRKKRLCVGYQVTAVLYGIISLLIAVIGRVPYFAAGAFLMSGTAQILKGAAQNNRLSSATYKRLNIALFSYAALEAFQRLHSVPQFLVANAIAMVQAVKGYGYGLKGWELKSASAKKDLLDGLISNLAGVFYIPNITSAGYWAATATMLTLIYSKVGEIMEVLADGAGLSTIVTVRMHRLAKYILLSSIVYTLKDASDRGRLEGTTFIRLNFMTAATFASMTGYLFAEASALTLEAAWCGLISLFSAFNGFVSMKKNKQRT